MLISSWTSQFSLQPLHFLVVSHPSTNTWLCFWKSAKVSPVLLLLRQRSSQFQTKTTKFTQHAQKQTTLNVTA